MFHLKQQEWDQPVLPRGGGVVSVGRGRLWPGGVESAKKGRGGQLSLAVGGRTTEGASQEDQWGATPSPVL